MNARERLDSPNPDQYVSKDVSDLRSSFGRLEERIEGVKASMATKADLANWRARGLQIMVNVLVSLLTAAIGALAAIFVGAFRGP